MTTPPLLPYASPRNRWPRRVILLSLLLAAGTGVGAYRWGRPLYLQAQVLLDQRRLTHFAPPPGTVAFTNDRAESAGLLAGGKHLRVPYGEYGGTSSSGTGGAWAGYVPDAARSLHPFMGL